MPLVEIWKTNPDTVYSFSIEQVIATAGDGNLKDGGDSSYEYRIFLKSVPSEKLFEYIDSCLTRSFPKSGHALQDLINELGRRLDYDVENGLYQGRPKQIGFDGLWRGVDGYSLVIEVKTTDAYRINLDTIASYREALIEKGEINKDSSILIVVGRSDTGDFEQQVRGSKHGWDIRLISADSLVNLVKIKEETNEEEVIVKIQQILRPVEYTRVDRLVDIVFSATKDALSKSDTSLPATVEIIERGISDKDEENIENDGAEKSIKENILKKFRETWSVELIKKSRALYWSPDKSVRLACAISRRYEKGGYWYAYHPQWQNFLSEAEKATFVLAFKDRNYAYYTPYGFIDQYLTDLYTTTRDDGKKYWHLEIVPREDDTMCLLIRKKQQRISLEKYRVQLTA